MPISNDLDYYPRLGFANGKYSTQLRKKLQNINCIVSISPRKLLNKKILTMLCLGFNLIIFGSFKVAQLYFL